MRPCYKTWAQVWNLSPCKKPPGSSDTRVPGPWLAESDHVTRILASDWSHWSQAPGNKAHKAPSLISKLRTKKSRQPTPASRLFVTLASYQSFVPVFVPRPCTYNSDDKNYLGDPHTDCTKLTWANKIVKRIDQILTKIYFNKLQSAPPVIPPPDICYNVTQSLVRSCPVCRVYPGPISEPNTLIRFPTITAIIFIIYCNAVNIIENNYIFSVEMKYSLWPHNLCYVRSCLLNFSTPLLDDKLTIYCSMPCDSIPDIGDIWPGLIWYCLEGAWSVCLQ